MAQRAQRENAEGSGVVALHVAQSDTPSAATPPRWLRACGFVPTGPGRWGDFSAAQEAGFTYLRWLFGLIWLYDTWTASSSAGRHALALFLRLPFSSAWVHLAGTGVLLVSLFIALALLSGKGLRAAFWAGLAYLLVLWVVVEHGGDFDPAAGGTDIGIAPPYALLLLLVCATAAAATTNATAKEKGRALFWAHAIRPLFGFVWSWDALYKLRPYFIGHFLSYLQAAAAKPGQPDWVIAWLHGWISVIGAISPMLFGVLTALIEVLVAWSLLSGRALRIGLPLGLVFSLLIWVTAEGFGGPYGNGTTGMPGNLLGTAILYALVFVGLMVLDRWPRCRMRRLAP